MFIAVGLGMIFGLFLACIIAVIICDKPDDMIKKPVGRRRMSTDELINIIKSECYISDLTDLDRTIMVNTALDQVISILNEHKGGFKNGKC